MSSKYKKKRHSERYVALYYYLLKSAAWKSLDAYERAIYVDMLSKYGGPGSNNGRLIYSCRMAVGELAISKDKAAKSLERLTDRGFIAPVIRGGFNRKGNAGRQATTWRLNQYPCDVTGDLSTKEFMRWSPPPEEQSRRERTKACGQNRVRQADLIVRHTDWPVRQADEEGNQSYVRSATRTGDGEKPGRPVRQADTDNLPGGGGPSCDCSAGLGAPSPQAVCAAPQPDTSPIGGNGRVVPSPPTAPLPRSPGDPEHGWLEAVIAFSDHRAAHQGDQLDLFAAPPSPPGTPRDRCIAVVVQWDVTPAMAAATVDRGIAAGGIEEVARLIGEANSTDGRRNHARRWAWFRNRVAKLASRAEVERVASCVGSAGAHDAGASAHTAVIEIGAWKIIVGQLHD